MRFQGGTRCPQRVQERLRDKPLHLEISAYGIHWPLIDEDLAIDGLLQSVGAAPAHPVLHEPPAEYRTD